MEDLTSLRTSVGETLNRAQKRTTCPKVSGVAALKPPLDEAGRLDAAIARQRELRECARADLANLRAQESEQQEAARKTDAVCEALQAELEATGARVEFARRRKGEIEKVVEERRTRLASLVQERKALARSMSEAAATIGRLSMRLKVGS